MIAPTDVGGYLNNCYFSQRRDRSVGLWPAIAIKLPDVSHFLDFVQVHFCNHQFILIAAAHGQELPARVAEIGLAIELAYGPRLFDADAGNSWPWAAAIRMNW